MGWEWNGDGDMGVVVWGNDIVGFWIQVRTGMEVRKGMEVSRKLAGGGAIAAAPGS